MKEWVDLYVVDTSMCHKTVIYFILKKVLFWRSVDEQLLNLNLHSTGKVINVSIYDVGHSNFFLFW